MIVYILIEAVVGIVAGILLAARAKKADNVVKTKLDAVGSITNSVFLPLYVVVSPYCMVLGMLCRPNYDGFLGIVGWIVSVFVASVPMFCGLGLGGSVALRKQGRSKLSFAVQFAGVIAILLAVLIFTLLYGNLLAPLEHPNT